MGFYLLMWGIFTGFLFIGSLKINKALQVVFGTLTLLFFLLAIRDFSGNEAIGRFAGVEGIICGLSAIYAGLAQVLNELYGKTIMTLGVKK
jgi:succinate-acetate transporter protein